MQLDPKKLWAVGYDSSISFLSDSQKEAEQHLSKEKEGKYGSLPWKCLPLDEYISKVSSEDYQEGIHVGQESMEDY